MNLPDQDTLLKWAAMGFFGVCCLTAIAVIWRGVTRINRNVYLPAGGGYLNAERSEPRWLLLARMIFVLGLQGVGGLFLIYTGQMRGSYLGGALWGVFMLVLAFGYVRWLHARMRAEGRKIRD